MFETIRTICFIIQLASAIYVVTQSFRLGKMRKEWYKIGYAKGYADGVRSTKEPVVTYSVDGMDINDFIEWRDDE